jgi:hypothetical protein
MWNTFSSSPCRATVELDSAKDDVNWSSLSRQKGVFSYSCKQHFKMQLPFGAVWASGEGKFVPIKGKVVPVLN